MAKTIFMMPEGNADFDELGDGEKMSFSGTLRKEPDGKACLISVDGKTIDGYSDDDEEEDEVEEVSEEDEGGDFMAVMDEQIPNP